MSYTCNKSTKRFSHIEEVHITPYDQGLDYGL